MSVRLPKRSPVPRGEIRKGAKREFETYLNNGGIYPELAESSAEASDKAIGAKAIPGVHLVISASLDVLNRSRIQARLPDEVAQRMLLAVYTSDYIASLIRSRRKRAAFDQASAQLATGVEESPTQAKIKGLSRAPFLDASMAGGGAVRHLQENGVNDDDYPEILSRSTGLLDLARISQDNMELARMRLGSPYIESSRYVLLDGEDGLEVDFNESAKEVLQSIRTMQGEGRGCPARRLITPGTDVNQSYLEERWGAIMHYMASPGAVASDHPGAYIAS